MVPGFMRPAECSREWGRPIGLQTNSVSVPSLSVISRPHIPTGVLYRGCAGTCYVPVMYLALIVVKCNPYEVA